MELSEPRPHGTQGKKPTHNFLSLYSPAQQDPSSTPGGFLETHDFLQPLERVGKNIVKEGNKFEEPPPPETAVEHILPGGMGTYSITHISCISQSQSQSIPKAEGVVITAAQSSGSDKNDEQEGGMKMGGVPWMTSMERPSQSSSAHNHPTTTTSTSSLSSSRPSSAQKNPNFVDTLKYAKSSQDDVDDEHQKFVVKKELSSHYKDTTHCDQKPNTPRSKHSATEQRRRSKINNRFSMLRGLIPHGDQKCDKASFLLEVVEHIRFLQEKVHKYEDSCRGWTNQTPTMNPWNNNNNQIPTEGFIDGPLVKTSVSEPALVNTCNVSLNHPQKGQTLLDTDLSYHEQIGQQSGLTNKESSFPSPLQSNIYSTLAAKSANKTSQLMQPGSYTNDYTVANDKLKDEDATIESGTINISTIYSQRLLCTLTQALQNAGVDLSQANVSVQIDLGKRANPVTPILKKNEVSAIDETLARSRLASTREEKSDKSLKRFKANRL